MGSIPGSGRSPRGGNGLPLQYSCLGNPMDREAWWAMVHGSQRVQHDWAHTHPHPPTHTHTHIQLENYCTNPDSWLLIIETDSV